MDIIMDIKPKIEISTRILALIANIDEFRGSWGYFSGLSPERMQHLRQVASIESVGSSTRIEGAKLSDAEVEALLSGLDIRSFKSRDEQEVAGYAKTQETVFESWQNIGLTENNLKQLHRDLLRFSTKDERHRGEYKKFPNNVEAFDKEGKSIGVVFKTSSPFDTPNQMQALISWTNQEWEKKEIHLLLIIGIFIVQFLAIHPFQDGNGRLSRVLTTLLLLRAGYLYVPYCSLEKVIEDNKENYYKSLRATQKGLNTKKEDLKPWLVFFLQSLKAQKDSLKIKLEKQKIIAPLSPLSSQIIELARDEQKLTIRTITMLTGANRNTVKANVQKLVNEGYLLQHGVGKGTYYVLVSSFL